MQQAFLERIDHFLATEETLVEKLNKTQAAIQLSDERKGFLDHLRVLIQSDDLSLMIETETRIISGDLSRYANSGAMVSSLKKAMEAMQVITRHIALVGSKEKYSIVDQSHSTAKNRKAGLPFDEARQALASHYTRLLNLDKSRLDEADKQTINARKAIIANAIACYTQRQAQILGIARDYDSASRLRSS